MKQFDEVYQVERLFKSCGGLNADSDSVSDELFDSLEEQFRYYLEGMAK